MQERHWDLYGSDISMGGSICFAPLDTCLPISANSTIPEYAPSHCPPSHIFMARGHLGPTEGNMDY